MTVFHSSLNPHVLSLQLPYQLQVNQMYFLLRFFIIVELVFTHASCVCPAGLHIVYTQDEVDVVQNLMFYIEAAYKVAVRFSSVSI